MTMKTSGTHQAAAPAWEQYTTGSFTSADGTALGYRQYGHGPGIVLVQGAMGSAQNFSHLAAALSESFTVSVPDRRGRGLSPLPYRKDHTIQRDVEDLEALLTKTGAHHVFALSSGAVIALTAAIGAAAIQKLAVYEPPLFERHPLPTAQLARFDKAIAEGNVALTFLTNRMLASEDKQPKGDSLTLRELAAALPYDFRVVSEMHGAIEHWSAIQAEVLLLGGSKSPAYLKGDLDSLEKVLPHVTRLELRGLGHAASWNYDKRKNPGGKPELVAQALRRFFAEA
jgi:pimeloyl-ACP methyl ester carboxylesterase